MKAILLALACGFLLAGFATLRLGRGTTVSAVRIFMRTFAVLLVLLVAAHSLLPDDLGFLPAWMVSPLWWVDLGFCVFLFAAGFFGGVMQLYNLADRGFSLRIL